MIEYAGLSALITAACLALSGFVAVCFKSISISRCSKIHACCFSCDRDVLPPELTSTQANAPPAPALAGGRAAPEE